MTPKQLKVDTYKDGKVKYTCSLDEAAWMMARGEIDTISCNPEHYANQKAELDAPILTDEELKNAFAQ